VFEARDISYVRMRLFDALLIAAHIIDKDLAECGREDIDKIVIYCHQVYKTPTSKEDLIKSLKFIWMQLFLEIGEKWKSVFTLIR